MADAAVQLAHQGYRRRHLCGIEVTGAVLLQSQTGVSADTVNDGEVISTGSR